MSDKTPKNALDMIGEIKTVKAVETVETVEKVKTVKVVARDHASMLRAGGLG